MRTTEPNEYSKKVNGVPTDHKAVGSPVSKDGNIQIDDIKEQNYLGNNVMLYETATGFGRVPTLDDNGKVAKNQIPDSIGSIPITIDGKKVVSMAFSEIIPPPTHSEIYGVDQVGRQNPLALPRTDDAVGKKYSLVSNDNGTSGYTSDFDSCYPWSDITEVTDSKGNTFVRIPKFYHKYTLNSNGTYHIQISGHKHDETWLTCFINNGVEIPYMDIGKYESSGDASGLKSIAGQSILLNKYIGDYRTYAMANGIGYHQYDIWNHQVIELLFTVEFATTNSQSIMQGNVSSYSARNTGSTNTVPQNTGVNGSITDNAAIKYRGIENPWGNAEKWCDGINLKEFNVYICNDINFYTNAESATYYTLSGKIKGMSDPIKTMAPCEIANKQILIPKAATADSNTHFCDRAMIYSSSLSLKVGGSNNNPYGKTEAGLWKLEGSIGKEYCARLCYKPISEV